MRRQRYSQLANKLKPYLSQAQLLIVNTGGSGEAPGDHVHSFLDLEGEIQPYQAPWINTALNLLKPHGITDPVYHSVTGAALSVVGLTADNTIGLLASTSDGALNPDTLLRSGPAGELSIGQLFAAADTDTASFVGRAAIGATNGPDRANFAHLDHGGNPAISQDAAGATVLRSALGQFVEFGAGGALQARFYDGQLRLFPSTMIQTDNFTSFLAGWRMTYAGELDARYIQADQLKIKIFVADLEMALAGSQIVSKSVTTLADPFVAPRPGLGTTIVVDDLPSAENMPVFEDGDVVAVRVRERAGGGLNVTDCWGVVDSYLDYHDDEVKKQSWSFTRLGDYSVAVPVQYGGRNATSNSNFITVDRPDGIGLYATMLENDLLLAWLLVESTSVVTTAPAGWTLLQTATVTGMRASLYMKLASASEPATYTWNHSGSVDSLIAITATRGHEPSAPITGSIIHPQETATSAPVIKSLDIVSDDDYYMGFVAVRSTRTIIQPDGWSMDGATLQFGGNSLGRMHTLTVGYAGDPFGDVSASLLGGTARTITATVNVTPLTAPLTLESGYMPIGQIVATGATVQDYGVSGDGWHEISAIDGLYGANAPYSRVVQWYGHPATGARVRTLEGNLKGIFGADGEFGFFAGDGVGIADHYVRISSLAAMLNNIGLKLYKDGTQTVNIASTGDDFWLGPSVADKRISWNGVNLGIKGAVTIDQASGFAGTGYLQIGAGVKDSNLNGWNLGPAEIVGQLSGVDQVVLDLSGRILAGAGAVRMDANGIHALQQTTESRIAHSGVRAYNFRRSDNGELIGRLTGTYLSSIDQYGIDLYALSPGSQKSKAVFGAQYYDAIYGGGSPGAPRVEAYSDPGTMDYLRLYSAGKIQLFQSGSATPDIEISSGSILPYSPFSAIGLGVAPTFGTWTSSNWQKMIEMTQGMTLLWRKGASGSARGIGASSDGVLYITSSTANDNSAGANYDFVVYPSGEAQVRSNLTLGGFLYSSLGASWNFGAYAGGAPTPTGYITVVVNGSNYRIAAQAV